MLQRVVCPLAVVGRFRMAHPQIGVAFAAGSPALYECCYNIDSICLGLRAHRIV